MQRRKAHTGYDSATHTKNNYASWRENIILVPHSLRALVAMMLFRQYKRPRNEDRKM